MRGWKERACLKTRRHKEKSPRLNWIWDFVEAALKPGLYK